MVVPIAATAWELARSSGDDELLDTAYRACSAWDDWLMRHRNTRGTGLIEGFCTYDTGHDNSPRWAGIPPQCPDKDAKKYPPIPTLPRLCPDLSATVYGGRVALSAMAKAMGKTTEAGDWAEHAEELRRLILSRLYADKDAAFYDLDAQNAFVGNPLRHPQPGLWRALSGPRAFRRSVGPPDSAIRRRSGRLGRCPPWRWTIRGSCVPFRRNSPGAALPSP